MQTNHKMALNIPETGRPRVIIIGGGFGGISAVKQLRRQGFQVVMFDKHNYNVFQPLLYQVATAAMHPDAIAGPFRRELQGMQDFHFRMLPVTGIDAQRRLVHTDAGSLPYDYLIIANGSESNFFGNSSLQEHVFTLKTLPDSLRLREHLIRCFEQSSLAADPASRDSALTIVIAGGGPTGVETAGALAELRRDILPRDYPGMDFSRMKIHLVEGAGRLLAAMSEQSGRKTLHDLEALGVTVHLNTLVKAYDGRVATLSDGLQIASDTVIWSAGVKSSLIAGLDADWLERGRLRVDGWCRIPGRPEIFAVGDIALLRTPKFPDGLPAVAQPAIQMGRYIGRNLRRLHAGKTVKPFSYFDYGSLATIGMDKAVVDFPIGLRFSGRIAWYIWLYVHISYLVSFRNKLLVFANWCWYLLTRDKGHRLILKVRMQD